MDAPEVAVCIVTGDRTAIASTVRRNDGGGHGLRCVLQSLAGKWFGFP